MCGRTLVDLCMPGRKHGWLVEMGLHLQVNYTWEESSWVTQLYIQGLSTASSCLSICVNLCILLFVYVYTGLFYYHALGSISCIHNIIAIPLSSFVHGPHCPIVSTSSSYECTVNTNTDAQTPMVSSNVAGKQYYWLYSITNMLIPQRTHLTQLLLLTSWTFMVSCLRHIARCSFRVTSHRIWLK